MEDKLHNSRKKFRNSFLATPAAVVSKIRTVSAAEFDNSTVARISVWLRKNALRLRIRAVGTFLITFGIYSALVCAFKFFFFDYINFSQLLFAAACVIVSCPLLASNGNISTALLKSTSGRTICDYLGIRTETMSEARLRGRANYSFLIGVLLGTITIVVPAYAVIEFLVMLICACIIFTVPETSLLFSALLLTFGVTKYHCVFIFLGVISFVIKLVRGKRSVSPAQHDKAAAVFLLVIFLASVISPGGNLDYTILMLSYFIAAFALGGENRAAGVLSAAVAVGGSVASVYTVFFIGKMITEGAGINIFSSGIVLSEFALKTYPTLFAALIPVSVSIMIKNNRVMPGHTAGFCFIAMSGFLIITGSFEQSLAVIISVVIMLMIYNRKAAYVVIAAAAIAVNIWLWVGGSAEFIYRRAGRLVGGATNMFTDDSSRYFAFGSGISSDKFGDNGNFISSQITALGIIGLIIFTSVLALIIAALVAAKRKPYVKSTKEYALAYAPFCSVISLLICGLSESIWDSRAVFVLFWMLLGMCSSCINTATKKANRISEAETAGHGATRAEITIDFE